MTAQARLLGGRYQVGELLGYGGMAEVHRGRDLRLGRDVAIKMLRTDLARDATFQMRFRREAQNAASLNHPAIVAVYDTGEEIAPTGETLPFIVMEFVNGRTLKEVLAAEGRLMPRRALEISADVCAALEFSHRHGIIHRDIKPGNVMMTQNGQVKVMDFGIARALASGATTMTQTSAVIGTAQYLSPEQARGEAVDARSDVYAAGCVVFELLCGHPPFVGDSPVSVAYQHVREDPRAPSEINPDVNPDVDAIVLKALAKNPLNRYQSAQEMRADLLRAAAGRPVMATPVLREAETVSMMGGAATRQINSVGSRPTVARVGDPGRRKASAWVIAALTALGVLAVVALVAGLILSNQGNETPQAQVPDVTNRALAIAQNDITNAGLKPVVGDQIFNDECTKGQVAKQTPTGGQKVERQSEVLLQVCGGPEPVKIPTNLVGGTFEFAKARLEEAGLVARKEEVDGDQAKDEVISLEPPAGTEVAKDSIVTVRVSKANIRQIPNVVGKSEEVARDQLDAAGFDVRVVDGDLVDPEEAGQVTDQSKTGRGKAGETITITVSQPRENNSPSPSASASPSPTASPDEDG
ncbi:Stk1 family PASTA domain-containing Ser/Thr kinase [Micromonospora sp. CPCC 206061]|uniref:Stk1 family PASTA domain-containing Ser/Thr kinase n=1 Tax=Micromonospora sp. CPCC 206061 TaxID=3122410 RepID=UPI002FEEF99F